MNFLSYKPESAKVLTGYDYRIDDCLGTVPNPVGFGDACYEWKVTRIRKGTNEECGTTKKLSQSTGQFMVTPENIDVNEEGVLNETLFTISKPNANGEQNFLIPVIGKKGSVKLGADYNDWK